MKPPLHLFVCALLLLPVPATVRAAETTPQPDAGGVTLEVPEDNKIDRLTTLSVSFPAAMVGTDKIDLAGEPCPIRFNPPVNGDWLWKSQTDGVFTVKAPITPDLKTAVRLAASLRDLAGASVAPPDWGTELHTEPFNVSTDWEERDHLGARPSVVLKFTYPVRLANVAGRIYFQDRDSAVRREAEFALKEDDRDDEPEAATLRVTPREPLPGGRTWDLIVENVLEGDSGLPIFYLKRVPLGTTTPMTIQWLGGFNLPLEKPLVRAHMDDYLDPDSIKAGAVSVDPPVPNMKVVADDEDLVVNGDFDRAKHYRLTINPSVLGRRGFGLAAPAKWGATFRPKPSAVYFPGERISERAALGLRFSFLQVHTGALRWRLAALPLEKLAAAQSRLREFQGARSDPISGETATGDDGLPVPKPTTLLVDTLGLATAAQGTLPASAGEAEDLREVRWSQPGKGGLPAGAYVLEVDGPAWDGKGTVGQRSILFFSESVITEKRTPEETIARVAGMADGLPRSGIPVRALSASNYEVARATTDKAGMVAFSYAQLHPARGERGGEAAVSLVADTPEGPSVFLLDRAGLDESYVTTEAPTPSPAETVRGIVFTDRSLYRPGQSVHFKGLVRSAAGPGKGGDEKLTVPAGASVSWQIKTGYAGEGGGEVVSGTASLDADGGWEADWTIPTAARLGTYEIASSVGGPVEGQARTGSFRVEEYKVPLFEVKATDVPGGVNAPASCRVRAGYFSGQPVAGAKVVWRVEWTRHDYVHSETDDTYMDHPPSPLSTLQIDDIYSENAKPPVYDDAGPPKSSGEAKLDARGEVVLRAELPKNLAGPRYDATWEIAVTSADGQTVACSDSPPSVVMRQPVLLGVGIDTRPPEGGPGKSPLILRAGAYDEHDKAVRLKEAKLELFHVTTKVVRETVAPLVVRYINKPVYTSVTTFFLKGVPPDAPPLEFPRDKPGRYVVVATAPGLQQVSAETTVEGPEEDEVPVRSQTSLEILPTKPEYKPGETAAFLTRSPVSGVAWVSIEAAGIIDSLLVPLPGNTTRIEFPVKAQYAPNARVAIYLLRPGGSDRLPAERFGTAVLSVKRPDRLLDVRPVLETTRVRPGDEVRGSVRVVSDGKPVANADATVWAVDDALLVLGGWQPPELDENFYPRRTFQVKTYAALRDYVDGIPRASLFEKGFIIGGGGEEFGNKFIRKDFQPLAYWKTGLKTDAGGNVRFSFAAPDNLTRYRVVAVAQTRDGRFGEGEGNVEIAKPLIVEPSLPRFLRAGDEVELRAVVRQSVHDKDQVAVTCGVDDGLTLDSSLVNPPAVTVDRDAPAVFRFRARVPDGPGSAKITMRGGVAPADPDMSDGVEITLPVLPPTILRRESSAGPLPAGGDVSGLVPEDARRPGAKGRYDVAVSTNADLPRLRALPEVLEYPHGCFEQITSRILVYCGVQSLRAGLPADPAREDKYKDSVQKGLALAARSLLDDGRLPYWSSQKTANPFVTVQAAWAVKEAMAAGLEVDEKLKEKISESVLKIIGDGGTPPYLRALGLMVTVVPASGGTGSVEGEESEFNEEAARAVYLGRERLGDEGRALLAVALHFGRVMPDEKRQLLREILPLANGSRRAPERAFDPATFATPNRAESLAIWAMSEVRPAEWKPADAANARMRLNKVLDHAPLNSTQENLWALLAYHALRKTENLPKLRTGKVRPAPDRLAPDGTAAEWANLPLGGENGTAAFKVPTDVSPSAGTALSCVLSAEYRVGKADEDTRRDRGGMRVERVVRNLTDPKRTGRPGEAPLRLNDRLLVTYRLQTPKLRSYVALEDELPAALETLNPDLPLFAPFYELPPTPAGQKSANLSSSELRDHATLLYFDQLEPGVSAWSVLARVTAAGTFRWPATQAGPMYEPAVSGLAPSEQIVVSGE